jgi:phytoene dehydrogenase-like protein
MSTQGLLRRVIMPEKSIIIIGAGIAGLATGIYGRMNEYNTHIFEMNIKPGGLCTAWERQEYVIDGCLHWLVGTSSASNYHHFWQEVGVLHSEKIIDMDIFFQIETPDGKTVSIYSDVDRLEKHLKEFAPEDTAFIEEFTKAIRRFTQFNLPADKAPELYSPLDSMKMITKMTPFMGEFQRWGKMTMKEFAGHFKNPILRNAWQTLWPVDFSPLFILMTLAWMSQKNAGYIIGGSMKIALNMEKRYHDLGGNITYKAQVEKILVENNRAVGVRLSDGTEHKADYIISAADGHSTIWNMLGGRYIDNTIRSYYEMPIFQPLVYIGLGVYRSFRNLPQMISGLMIPLDVPLMIGTREHKYMNVHIYNFDPSFDSDGKTVLTVMFESDFSYWSELAKDKSCYKEEKERIAIAVVSALNKRFPGLARQLEMWDVATPVTFHRYTGNWQGSYEGWLMTPQNLTLRMKKTLPGLNNFYMAGQWVSPGGGLPSALISGCHVIQILCKLDLKKYHASFPSEKNDYMTNN